LPILRAESAFGSRPPGSNSLGTAPPVKHASSRPLMDREKASRGERNQRETPSPLLRRRHGQPGSEAGVCTPSRAQNRRPAPHLR
jgi:hypothetical protein